jgi:protein TonB
MTAEQKLKNDYPKMFRNGLVWALVIHVLAFVFVPDIKPTPYRLREKPVVEAIDIPDQFEIPPPPKEEVKPQVPTEIAPSDEASEEETIAATTFEVDAPPELPPAPQRPQFFTAFDEPPQVIRQVPPEYPELARQSETEGVVLVQIGVNEFGDVIEATVVQGVPMLNQAAIEAVMQWKFRPAKQRDVPVPVRIVVPIRFTLRG